MGGIGSCGRELCCKTHLANFDFVTMKMAKEQGMALNTNKISGICDKLMCCIAYEHELYKELKKELPAVGQMVKTPSCDCCKIVSVDYIKKIVRTNENPNGAPTPHNAADVELIDLTKEVKDNAEVITTIDNEEITVIDNSLNNIEYNDEEKIETVSFTKEEAVENDNNKKNNNNKHKNRYHKHHKPKQGNKNGKGENRSN